MIGHTLTKITTVVGLYRLGRDILRAFSPRSSGVRGERPAGISSTLKPKENTEMAKSSTTKTLSASDHVEIIVASLEALMAPTLSALADTPARAAASDTGQEPRRQASFRYFFQGLVNNAHHQLAGNMNGFDNATALVTRSDAQFRELVRKYHDDDTGLVSDPNYHRITSWFRVNEENKNFFEAMKLIGELCYQHVTGKPCTPVVFAKKETAVAAAIDQAQIKKRLAELRQLKEKVAVEEVSSVLVPQGSTLAEAGVPATN
jgi:hypothetical protein